MSPSSSPLPFDSDSSEPYIGKSPTLLLDEIRVETVVLDTFKENLDDSFELDTSYLSSMLLSDELRAEAVVPDTFKVNLNLGGDSVAADSLCPSLCPFAVAGEKEDFQTPMEWPPTHQLEVWWRCIILGLKMMPLAIRVAVPTRWLKISCESNFH